MRTTSIAILTVMLLGAQSEARAFHEGHPHEAPSEGVVEATKVEGEKGETIRVKAKGLVCDYCARALEKVFMKRPEVLGLSVDLTTKLIEIRLKEGQTLDDETIEKLVAESGYTPFGVERQA